MARSHIKFIKQQRVKRFAEHLRPLRGPRKKECVMDGLKSIALVQAIPSSRYAKMKAGETSSKQSQELNVSCASTLQTFLC